MEWCRFKEESKARKEMISSMEFVLQCLWDPLADLMPSACLLYLWWFHCMLHGWIVWGWLRMSHVLVHWLGSVSSAWWSYWLVVLWASLMDPGKVLYCLFHTKNLRNSSPKERGLLHLVTIHLTVIFGYCNGYCSFSTDTRLSSCQVPSVYSTLKVDLLLQC